MKIITVLATGTRGDVQPFISLAYGLAQAGHRVRVVTNEIFEPWVRSYGLEVRTVSWDPRAAMLLQNQLAKTKNPLVHVRAQRENTNRIFPALPRESFEACQGTDYLFFSMISPWGYSIGEKLNVPMMAGMLHPLERTRTFPMQFIPINLGDTLNWASHVLAEHIVQMLFRKAINPLRVELGLPRQHFPFTLLGVLREKNIPLLTNLSPTIISRPHDWPERIHMDGYWFLPTPKDWTPPAALTDFLACGDAPIYIGFGSTLTDDAAETGRMVIEALHQIKHRAVLVKGWGALEASALDPEQFIVVDDVPHDWLFPQMAAIVHHGGAGTTASAFHAGVPQLVIPHIQDQPYWGNKTFQLGVGAKPVPRTQLTIDALAHALQSIIDSPSMQTQAQQIGEQVRKEDGLEKAVAAIEKTFNLTADQVSRDHAEDTLFSVVRK